MSTTKPCDYPGCRNDIVTEYDKLFINLCPYHWNLANFIEMLLNADVKKRATK